jgi:hypothetical protein
MLENDDTRPAPLNVGSGYPAAQLARALVHAGDANDPQAQERARRWIDVLMGMLGGALEHGHRQPVASLPTWVTLEVVTGGFATGAALSGGALRGHEVETLREIGIVDAAQPRLALNRYFLSDSGLQRLGEALRQGRYRIEVPEEGALLVVAWLTEHGHPERARDLVGVLAPHMAQLRFYPILTDAPCASGSLVYLEDVGTTIRRLNDIRPNARVLAQREAVGIWTPLYDRLVALFLETVIGDPPVAGKDAGGAWQRGSTGQFVIRGGWPCAQYGENWRDRATLLMDEVRAARASRQLRGKASRSNESFATLIDGLGRILADPASLSGRDVGRIRLVIARYIAKRGLPGSAAAREMRERQIGHATAPTYQEVARHVSRRLTKWPQHEGLDDLADVVSAIDPGESDDPTLARGAQIPPSIVRKLERCMRDSVEMLVERGIIPSGEVLAQVLPQLTSALRSAGIADPALRGLYAAVYRAFRRRRSLLLLDLQQQVRLEELPWVQAIDRHRSADLGGAELARQALLETSALALKAFPQAIIPNKLIQELTALAGTADLAVPLTEEVAADIFMGRFSPKFDDAVRLAASALRGSIYARYYAIDYDCVVEKLEGSDSLATLCAERAGVKLGTYHPTTNGQVIEQQLVLTTHNLAALAGLEGMSRLLRNPWCELAKRCFQWITEHLQLPDAGHHVALLRIKNAAYAWRQMVFFISHENAGESFLDWAHAHLETQQAGFRSRFEPALRRLELAVRGEVLVVPGVAHPPVFFGWASGRHWLMAAAKGTSGSAGRT